MSFTSLPEELIDLIVWQLSHEALLQANQTCHLMNRICHPIIKVREQERQQYARKWSHITELDFKALRPWPWHRILLLILTRKIHASWIKHIEVDSWEVTHSCRLRPRDNYPAQDAVQGSKKEYHSLIADTVASLPWNASKSQHYITKNICRGNEEFVQHILFPLLTNLTSLNGRTATFVDDYAKDLMINVLSTSVNQAQKTMIQIKAIPSAQPVITPLLRGILRNAQSQMTYLEFWLWIVLGPEHYHTLAEKWQMVIFWIMAKLAETAMNYDEIEE